MHEGEAGAYGGYYTQDELRDLVAGPIVLPAPDEDAPAETTGAPVGADGSGEDLLA